MLENLLNKINLIYNEEKTNNELFLEKRQEINSQYFYNEWLKTFDNEKYKKDSNFCHFINLKYMVKLNEIKNIIVTLIPTFKINLFEEEPGQFEDKVVQTIEKYA